MVHLPAAHCVIAATAPAVPRPFKAFAVSSDEARYAGLARAPYTRVHGLHLAGLDGVAVQVLAREAYARVRIGSVGDIDHATTTPAAWAVQAPAAADWPARLAAALQRTGVLGPDVDSYRRHIDRRVDYLASRGAGFHNDVARHWPRCLFWVLALDVDDVAFVMPHAGVRAPLAPGDLLVFDPTLAHGLCRPDEREALGASFDAGERSRQLFLTGELLLSDAQWAALGAPWLPLAEHQRRGALDLRVATFDERSGTIQRLGALRGCMGPDAEVAGEPSEDPLQAAKAYDT